MQRIAIIAGPLHSGGKRNLIMEYYRHIDHNNVQYDFICDANSNGIPREEIEALGGRVFIVPPYSHCLSHMMATYKILKSNHYEIMHAFDNTLNVFPLLLAKLAGVKVRISESISKGDKHEKKTTIKLILRLFSHFFATHYMANSIDCGVWQFGRKAYNNGKVSIFKTVINVGANAFNKELRDTTRNSFGWDNKIVYGFIGRYVDQKNLLFLIDVFNEIAKKQENAILVLVGFGELEQDMHNRIKQYGLDNKVCDLGRRDDIKQFYNAFDAFLLPSLYEGMPVVGVESQACGLPIFFSTEITKETVGSDMANFISLEAPLTEWADKIIERTGINIPVRKSHVDDLIKNGFDSASEAERLQRFYMDALS